MLQTRPCWRPTPPQLLFGSKRDGLTSDMSPLLWSRHSNCHNPHEVGEATPVHLSGSSSGNQTPTPQQHHHHNRPPKAGAGGSRATPAHLSGSKSSGTQTSQHHHHTGRLLTYVLVVIIRTLSGVVTWTTRYRPFRDSGLTSTRL